MKAFNNLAVATGIAALLAGAVVLATSGTSGRGIVPRFGTGNFVADNDQQVCYELARLGLLPGFAADGDMRGYKIDPPRNYSDGFVSATISADGKYLGWESTDATVHAFIIKGGNSYHVYGYTGTGYVWDNELHSPLMKRSVPQISHYNVCYTPDQGEQGCTPGYWRNHTDRWLGAASGDDFDATFGVDLFSPNITLGQAVQLNGGGINAFARHATAALLNSLGGVANTSDGKTVNYPYTTSEVIAMVQEAIAEGTLEGTKDLFEAANELGCPLSGTPATGI